jgi:hypothetical protein
MEADDAHPPPHLFGGDWTTEKLELVRRYLVSYTTALKKTRFRIAYIY